MSKVFTGAVLLPGESGPGLSASFELGSDAVRLFAGDEELGTWGQRECVVVPAGKGSFRLELGGEELTFSPSSPSSFAEAMTVPLQPEPAKNGKADKPAIDIDAAIDDAIANVRPLSDPKANDDILTKPMLFGIVGTAAILMVGLIGMSMVL